MDSYSRTKLIQQVVAMAFSKQDRANITASSLIGFCRSASAMIDAPKDRRKAWADSLMELAEELALKIDNANDYSGNK